MPAPKTPLVERGATPRLVEKGILRSCMFLLPLLARFSGVLFHFFDSFDIRAFFH
jgi:hypothetical protein